MGKMTEADSLFQKYLRIFVVVSGYWIVSILTVFLNKTLLSDINLDAPIFIAFSQTVISALICLLMKTTSNLFPQLISFPPISPFAWNTIKNVLPLSVLFMCMLATNNLCLKYVSVAFYYIGRSLTTIFNVVFTYLILKEKTSGKCIFFCFLIVFGFYLGVDQENLAGSLSVSGTIFGVLASLSLSLFSIYTKKVLPLVNQEVLLLSYYNNLYCSIMLVPAIIFSGEAEIVANYADLFNPSFILIMIIGGVCGFSIGILTSLQIKVTSALTHNISGTAKACAQTILATYWYQETKSALWWFSNAIVLFGSAGYARIKQLEIERKHRLVSFEQKM